MKSSKFKPRGRGEGVAVLCSWARQLIPIVSFHLGLHLCDSKLAGKHQNKFGGGSCGVMLCGVV